MLLRRVVYPELALKIIDKMKKDSVEVMFSDGE